MPTKRKINGPKSTKPATDTAIVALGAATANLGKNTQADAPKAPAAKTPNAKKPAAATKPGKLAATANVKAERAELHAKARETVVAFYAGPSPTVHVSAGSKLGDVIARVRKPIQQIAKNPTMRDGSLAIAIARVAGDLGSYLSNAGCDLGGISRLASVGAIVVSGDTVAVNRAKLNAVIIATHGAKHVPGAKPATAKPAKPATAAPTV